MRLPSFIFSFTLMIGALLSCFPAKPAFGAPVTVVLPGDFQSEVGCSSDFDLQCATSSMVRDPIDGIWTRTLNIPQGTYSYFAALNGTFAETYGLNGANPGGTKPVTLALSAARNVKFYYDDQTHWVTDNVNSPIVILAGSFQSELGCQGDFLPDCHLSWLEDVDGDGIFTRTVSLPVGNYSTVVTVGESFGEVYGLNGVPGGANIDFVVSGNYASDVLFCYTNATHVLHIGDACMPTTHSVPEPGESAQLAMFLLAVAGIVSMQRRRSGPKVAA